jgi:large subunit ribosomal protein L10
MGRTIMKSFTQKKKELAKLKEKLAKSKLTVFTSFSRAGEKGLNVKSMQALKRSLRAVESEYAVEKKTLLDKALDGKVDIFGYDGSLGVVFGYGEVSAAAKSVYEFSRKNPALKLFSAIFGDKILDNKDLIEFAKLPTKDVMIARFLGLLKYPLSSLANVLGEVAKTK